MLTPEPSFMKSSKDVNYVSMIDASDDWLFKLAKHSHAVIYGSRDLEKAITAKELQENTHRNVHVIRNYYTLI